ncbi:MAG: rhodanese-related sulfurtransferase [Halieaceae bacterium]|jgi:rhodanese-related sulfurtransferase
MKSALDLVAAAKVEIREVAPEAAQNAVLEADILIDVREDDEYRDGHIGGSINIPRGLLEFMLSSDQALQDRSRHYLLYCKTSGRAALAAKSMQEMGYLHVSSIGGGFDAWKAAHNPVALPAQPKYD